MLVNLTDAAAVTVGGGIHHNTGPMFLDNVGCRGNEKNLFECTHNGVGVHNCYYWQYAGVICLQGLVLYCLYLCGCIFSHVDYGNNSTMPPWYIVSAQAVSPTAFSILLRIS